MKGDVFYVEYEGNSITGKKVFAVAKKEAIDVWVKIIKNPHEPREEETTRANIEDNKEYNKG